MSSIKKLASQTLWYGGSYVAARFLNVFLKFILTHILAIDNYGVVSKVYIYTTFLTVLFTYGLETTYFRFIQNKPDKKDLYNTSFFSIVFSTLILSGCMVIWAKPLAELWKISQNPEWIIYFAFILGFDAICAIPFARLRQEQRPVKYAFIKFLNIFLQVVLTLYFLLGCPWLAKHHPHNFLLHFYSPATGVGYVFIANMIASILTLVFLFKEVADLRFSFNAKLWRAMMVYSLPLVIVGFGGMINEVVDRVFLDYLLPYSQQRKDTIIAIYQAGYMFAMLINIFIQIFRMGAEPFFFNEMNKSNAKETYARVMKFFVIGSCWMFLFIVLFSDLWMHLNLIDVRHYPEYAGGFAVIPQLALGYICLGVYYNLSIWYKFTNKTLIGAYITVAGAVLTIVLNLWWIPKYSYVGCAWASFLCYFVMMVLSFLIGQKHYPVPYEWKKLSGYITLAAAAFLLHLWIKNRFHSLGFTIVLGIAVFLAYLLFTLKMEKKEFIKLPVIGRYLG